MNDLWSLDVNALAFESGKDFKGALWLRLGVDLDLAPAPRMGHGFAAAAGALYVFSGQSYSGGC